MILDTILILLFMGIIFYGYKKGAIRIVAKLVSVMLAFVIAYLLAATVGEYISKTSWGVNIQTNITQSIVNKLSEQTNIEDNLNLQDAQEANNIDNNIENKITSSISGYVFSGMGFAIVFIASRLVLWIGQKILEMIFELPVLKTFNQLGGIVTAVLLFVIELNIILAAIKAMSAIPFMRTVVSTINSTVITRFVYDNNIITYLFTKL